MNTQKKQPHFCQLRGKSRDVITLLQYGLLGEIIIVAKDIKSIVVRSVQRQIVCHFIPENCGNQCVIDFSYSNHFDLSFLCQLEIIVECEDSVDITCFYHNISLESLSYRRKREYGSDFVDLSGSIYLHEFKNPRNFMDPPITQEYQYNIRLDTQNGTFSDGLIKAYITSF